MIEFFLGFALCYLSVHSSFFLFILFSIFYILAGLNITLPIQAHIATCLSYRIDDMGLINHIPLSERY